MEDEKPADAGSASAADEVAGDGTVAANSPAPPALERIGDDDAAQDRLAGAAPATGGMADSDTTTAGAGTVDGTVDGPAHETIDERIVATPENTTTVAESPTSATTAATAAGEGPREAISFTHPPPTQTQPHPNTSSSQPQSPTAQTPPTGGGSGNGKQPLAGAGFVAPSSYLRPLAVRSSSSQEKKGGQGQGQWEGGQNSGSGSGMVGSMGGPVGGPGGGVGGQRMKHPLDKEQTDGLRAIRAFLKVRTTYDVLPLSYRLIVLDTSLLVKKSLNILNQCGIVSAPLWDSQTSTFAGLLTTSDYLNVVQYYWQNPDALAAIDQFKLNSLRDIERALGVTPIETVSIHPLKTLYEACRRMLESRARRIPLVDIDDETQREMVVSVLTQYRILKFVSVNVKETQMLRKPLRDLHIGTYENLSYAHMESPVMEVIHALVKRSISSVPILDRDGAVLNVFEAVDVIALIKGGDYDNLQLTVGKALEKRSEDFPGIYTCTLNDRLDTIFDTIRKSRVHRLVVIDERSQLVGLLSLSDILDYTLNSPLGDGNGGEES